MNYLTSHDDGSPFDKDRKRTYEAGTKLLLAPGISQIYYGDETARPLKIAGAEGDANLRSNMNWDDIATNSETKKILKHWQKLGQFRANHPAIGAGIHQMLSKSPYYFSRTLTKDGFTDKVVIGLDLKTGQKVVNVHGVFNEGDRIRDAYSGATMPVINGKVSLNSAYDIVLLEKK